MKEKRPSREQDVVVLVCKVLMTTTRLFSSHTLLPSSEAGTNAAPLAMPMYT